MMCLFASLDGKPWGTISTARSAVRAWHEERGLVDPFDSAWTDRAARFWKGLKKRADHTLSRAKVPLSLTQLLQYVRARRGVNSPAG
eukprot:9062969-Pyramimonas_sp.AAC.1